MRPSSEYKIVVIGQTVPESSNHDGGCPLELVNTMQAEFSEGSKSRGDFRSSRPPHSARNTRVIMKCCELETYLDYACTCLYDDISQY
jgi:hypothetical protein